MNKSTYTIADAQVFIHDILTHGMDCVSFASAWFDEEDLYNLFYENVKNPTGDFLIEVFTAFYENDDLREELERVMLDAGEQFISNKIKEMKREEQ